MFYRSVSAAEFLQAFLKARLTSDKVAQATSQVAEVADGLTENDRCFLVSGGMGGFIVKEDGELIAVFSLVKGRGAALIHAAKDQGATHLDCFDGFLVDFYRAQGFSVVAREPNWTQGEPDIVWMILPSDHAMH